MLGDRGTEALNRIAERIKALEEERDGLLESLDKRRLDSKRTADSRDHWRWIAFRLKEALELLCHSVAGTEGTKTNMELPEWYRARLKDANTVLSTYESALKEGL